MKNVAATSGHSVSFATFFLTFGSAWEGSWAGRDNVLNFYFRPPRATLALTERGASSLWQNTGFIAPCKRKIHYTENLFRPINRTRYSFFRMSRPRGPFFRERALVLYLGKFLSRRLQLGAERSRPAKGSDVGPCAKLRRLLLALNPQESNRMRLVSLFLVVAAFLASPLGALARQSVPPPRPITIEDYFQIREVQDPQISPDSRWVAYTVETSSLKDDKSQARIWMVALAGGDPVPMTAEGVSSSHPRWSPDGKFLAILSARNEGKTQVWLLNRTGGEAQRLTDTAQDVQDVVWSPDSRRLCLILRDPTPEELEAARDKDKEGADKTAKEKKPKTQKPWVIDRLQFKVDEIGFLDHRRNHLYVFDLAAKSLTQVTSGDYDDSQPAWSPDGKQLAFTSNRSPDPDRTYNNDIWVVSDDTVDKGAHLDQITSNPGNDNSPAWSPDGKWIAHVTQIEPKLFEYATKHLAISPAAGGEAKNRTRAFDRNTSVIHFFAYGQYNYTTTRDGGTQNLCRIPVTGGDVTHAIGGRIMLYSYSLAKSGDIAAQIDRMDRPSEIYALSASGGQLNRVTHTNDALISQLRVSAGEYVPFKSKDGTSVSRYLYKPLDYTPGKKVPTLLRPHGGPVWAWYAEFQPDIQLFAANGYAVLLPHPRGCY